MNSRLNIQDLAGLLSEYTGKERAEIEQFLKCFISVVSEGVYSDKLVKIKGLGTFKIVTVEKRESINVNTGERFLIPAHYKFSFLPDKELREQVNKPFSVFETTEIKENVTFSDMDESVEDTEKEKETEDESVEEVMPEKEVVLEEKGTEEEVPQEEVEQIEKVEEVQPKEEEEKEADEIPEESKEQTKVEVEEPVQEELPLENTQEPQEQEIAEPQEVVKEEQPIPEKNTPKKKSNKKGLFFMVVALVMLLVALGCFMLGRYHCFPDPVIITMDTARVEAKHMIAVVDTLQLTTVENKKDSILEHPDKPNRDSVLAKVPLTDPMPPKPLAQVKIQRGDRLTVIALKYYGHKLFWVYIYKHNKALISDPNNVPIGTVINIPIPEMYGINAKSSSSRAKAAALQTEILSGN